ncbi:MAG: glycerol-3-phosphate dehydrogenase, partial [Kordiimonadaceae bacterium]|nr:glycerol-3-phosphate dehydrogenase [Kordiimonadaceae bacterium]
MAEIQDIFIIGGGINGTGIAADAAGRGLSVILCEQNDLSSGTSSASTKLVHGGLRYLEHYKFKLVRKALREREILLKKAPHIIKPIRFLLPHNGMRPEWFVRLGLFIYDHLGGRKILPPTKTRSLKKGIYAGILEKTYHKAFEYSDCWVDDSRLVILNACSARDSGAEILPKHKCISAIRKNGSWEIILKNRSSGENRTLKAKVLINAAGPWLDKVISNVLDQHKPSLVRLVKGSHIIVNKLYNHDRSYVFQGNKGRIIFAIPYQENFT